MRDEDATLVLLALVVMAGGRRVDITWGEGWVWPVPSMRLGGSLYPAAVSQEFHTGHNGVDIMYARRGRPAEAVYRAGTPDGSRNYIAPPRTPIVAARAGKIWSVQKTPKGYAVVIDHAKPFASFYAHLESVGFPIHANGVNTATGQPTHVAAGQPLGFMGFSPQDPERLRHLHFEVWYQGAGQNAVDTVEAMKTWQRPVWAFVP